MWQFVWKLFRLVLLTRTAHLMVFSLYKVLWWCLWCILIPHCRTCYTVVFQHEVCLLLLFILRCFIVQGILAKGPFFSQLTMEYFFASKLWTFTSLDFYFIADFFFQPLKAPSSLKYTVDWFMSVEFCPYNLVDNHYSYRWVFLLILR